MLSKSSFIQSRDVLFSADLNIEHLWIKGEFFLWDHCGREKAPVISLEWGIGSLHKVWVIMLEGIRKQRWWKVKYFQAFKNLMLTISSTYSHFCIKYENSSQYKVICKEPKWWIYKITENTWGSRASPLFFLLPGSVIQWTIPFCRQSVMRYITK